MENASKAIIMAGGILIALVIISILVIIFNVTGSVYTEREKSLEIEQIEEYNRKFATYNNIDGLYGSELLSLANLVIDYHNRLLYGYDINSEYYKENKVDITVYLCDEIIGIRDANNKQFINNSRKQYNIEEFKQYYDNIEKKLSTVTGEEYDKIKSLLTEIKSRPFVCVTKDNIKKYKTIYNNIEPVQYNKYGRISAMCFVEFVDEDTYKR